MALVDVLDQLPVDHPQRPSLLAVLASLAAALEKYQDPKTGLWFQVVDQGTLPTNWTETSCSAMHAYTLSRAVEHGYVAASYQEVASLAYRGVLATLSRGADGSPNLAGIVAGTNPGDLAHYLARPRETNNWHGLGAFMLMHEQFSKAMAPLAASEVGRRFPAERQILVDRTTGAVLTALTSAASNDVKIYQTHPQWAADGVHVIFASRDRSQDGQAQVFAVNEITGVIVQLTDGPGVNTGSASLMVARKSNRLYYLRETDRRTRLVELDLAALLSDSAPDAAGTAHERVVAVLPPEHRDAGAATLDADEQVAYLGVHLEDPPPQVPGQPLPEVPGGIRAVDLATGTYTKVIDTPFRIGHVQANPWVSGEILYCHETGGDAPQRMWLVRADGAGNRPLFEEEPKDLVTHEVFIDRDHVVFNLIGSKPEQRTRPTGVAVVSLRDASVELLGQVSGRGFLHSAGTANGRWAAGDTGDGRLYLIDRQSGERTLLTAGHSRHLHESFSPDGTRILFQSALLSGGKGLDLFVVGISPSAPRF
jgi:oligogalacturonide lyase